MKLALPLYQLESKHVVNLQGIISVNPVFVTSRQSIEGGVIYGEDHCTAEFSFEHVCHPNLIEIRIIYETWEEFKATHVSELVSPNEYYTRKWRDIHEANVTLRANEIRNKLISAWNFHMESMLTPPPAHIGHSTGPNYTF